MLDLIVVDEFSMCFFYYLTSCKLKVQRQVQAIGV